MARAFEKINKKIRKLFPKEFFSPPFPLSCVCVKLQCEYITSEREFWIFQFSSNSFSTLKKTSTINNSCQRKRAHTVDYQTGNWIGPEMYAWRLIKMEMINEVEEDFRAVEDVDDDDVFRRVKKCLKLTENFNLLSLLANFRRPSFSEPQIWIANRWETNIHSNHEKRARMVAGGKVGEWQWQTTTLKSKMCVHCLSAHSAYTIFGVEILSSEREREQYRIIQFRWLPVVVDDGFWEWDRKFLNWRIQLKSLVVGVFRWKSFPKQLPSFHAMTTTTTRFSDRIKIIFRIRRISV